MKTKNVLIVIISALFLAVTIGAVIMSFTLKNVSVSFDATEGNSYTEVLNDKLNEFKGRNLLFFNEKEMVNRIEENPYFEVVSIEKKLPTSVNVVIKERIAVYVFSYDGKEYFVSKDGYVLSTVNGEYNKREYIELFFDGIKIIDFKIGKKIFSDSDAIVYKGLSLCDEVKLTDCVKRLTVKSAYSTDVTAPIGTKQAIVIFNTYTEVDIVVFDALNYGEEKTALAFESYDKSASDYYKLSKGEIEAYREESGNIRVIWTREGSVVYDSKD